jgi:hypothetical protein
MKIASRGYIEPMSAWALQLLAHTGLRKDEIISLKWPMIDWQHAVFNLPDTKTGQRSVPVSSQVMTLLREIQEHTGQPRTGYVIRSRTGRRLTSLNKTWERIRVMAGIPDVRLHDLRHSFASDALMGGVPLAIIGKILGHRQPTTTQRYAHLSDRVVRDAIEQTSNRITDAAQPAQPTTPGAAPLQAPHQRPVGQGRPPRPPRPQPALPAPPPPDPRRHPLGPPPQRRLAESPQGVRHRDDLLALVQALARRRRMDSPPAPHHTSERPNRGPLTGTRGRHRLGHLTRAGNFLADWCGVAKASSLDLDA